MKNDSSYVKFEAEWLEKSPESKARAWIDEVRYSLSNSEDETVIADLLKIVLEYAYFDAKHLDDDSGRFVRAQARILFTEIATTVNRKNNESFNEMENNIQYSSMLHKQLIEVTKEKLLNELTEYWLTGRDISDTHPSTNELKDNMPIEVMQFALNGFTSAELESFLSGNLEVLTQAERLYILNPSLVQDDVQFIVDNSARRVDG